MATTLNGGRLFIASLALASLAFALDRCRTYAQERIQFDDKPIGRFQRVQDVILDMDIALEQGVTWLLHLVRQYDAGTLARESAAKVKIECSRRASELLPLAMEICGGVASLDEFGLMRHLARSVCLPGRRRQQFCPQNPRHPATDARYPGLFALKATASTDDTPCLQFQPWTSGAAAACAGAGAARPARLRGLQACPSWR